ncbi:T9SS type A sorting domain-containing protein, partial [Algoriphagus aestuariicola]
SAPYSYSWSNVSAGEYSITAKATDNKGAVTSSEAVKITVMANASPTISLTSPSLGGQFKVGETVSIAAAAADSDGAVAKVEFYNGTSLLGADTSAPYSYSWTNVSAGEYSITAKATDNKGAVATSEAVKITVMVNASPTISLTSPSSGGQFKVGETVSIAAAAADSDGTVAKVEFYNGTSLLGTDTSAPYSYSWSNVSAGEYSITAKVTDNKGAVTSSEAVKITVMANANPTISLTSPSTGTQFKVGETVSITAAAADSDGTVAKVEFYNGTSLLGTDTSAPYSYSWTNVSAGEYSITAKATDNKGAVTTSEAVKITVMANASPTISLTSPSTGAQFKVGKTVSITAAAADSDGAVAKVEFYNGTSLLGTDISAPYSYSWTNVSAGEYSITAKATDNKGAVTTSEAVKIAVLANAKPTVRLTSPSSGGQFKVGEAVSITAAAADSDGTVAKVEFYNGTSLLGTDTSAPYSYSCKNLSTGIHSITAKATDNYGAIGTSELVKVEVAEARDTSSNQEMTGGLADGLVSFYEMDTNVSGVLVDSHGNNHGTNSSIDQIKRGNGHSNRYNGKSSVSNVPHKSSLNLKTEFTLMADVYRLAQGQEHGSMIVGKTYSSSQPDTEAYSISITKDNKIRIRANIGYKKEWVSSKTVPEGKWVRVIATYKSGEGFSLYLDTTSPEKSGKFSGTLYQSSQGLTIGASRAAYRRRLEGRLDNVAIWNRKLSTTEIEKLITSKAASYAGLIGNQTYTVTMRTVTNQLSDDVAARTSIEAEAGEKLVFFVEGEQEGEIIFDYWSVDGAKVSEQSLFEMNMPERDITLTQHFKSFEAPEIRIFLPEGKTEVEALSTVHIGLEIEVNDAQIEKVELYNGETLVGELVDKFSGFDWKDIPEGTHELAAKITDASGKTYFSNPVVLKSVRDSANDMKQVLLDYVIGPNPAVEHLNIMFTNLDRTYDFEINVVSMSGLIQKTANVRPDGSKVTIDVSDLKNGVYILQLKANGNAVTSKKFIKQ